jgi:hypothetical protein
VDESSALLNVSNEVAVHLNRDHVTLVKFKSPTELAYLSVQAKIRELVDDAKQKSTTGKHRRPLSLQLSGSSVYFELIF